MKPEKPVVVWIQDRPSRFLTLEWTDPKTGKRRQRSSKTDDWKVAETQRAALEYELNHGTFKDTSRISWKDFREKVRREYAVHIRTRSAEKIETVLDAFDRLSPASKLSEVDESKVSNFAAKLRTEKSKKGKLYEPVTIRNYLVDLRTVLNWAESLKLTTCPSFPTIKVPKRLPRPVPAEAFERLLAAVPDERWRALLLCGWLAGLRINESLRLCRRPCGGEPYVDWERDVIVLPPPSNKSGDDQEIPLSKTLRIALASIPSEGDRILDIRNQRTGEPITRPGASKLVCNWAAKAGVKLSAHKMRSGYGSRLASKVQPQVLQRLMRHADVATTMGFYANVDEAARAAIDSLDDSQETISRGARRGAGQNRRKAG